MEGLIDFLKLEKLYLYISIFFITLIILTLIIYFIRFKIFKKEPIINKKNSYILLFCIFVFTLVAFSATYIYYNYDQIEYNLIEKALNIKKVSVLNYNKNKNLISIEIKISGNLFIDNIYCSLSNEEEMALDSNEWHLVKNNKCNLKNLKEFKYIFLKKNSEIKKFKIENYINEIFEIELKEEKIYLIIGESFNLNFNIFSLGNPKEAKWKSEDENIVTVDNGKLLGVGKGSTKVILTNGSLKEEVTITVTDLITNIHIDNTRPFLPCGRYTEEEANLLDQLLFYKVEQAGKNTRAGVVAAARFLSMQLPYKIPYFLENGRLTYPKRYGDGEGRYYHEGLYLNASKFNTIVKARSGPAIWGCSILEYDSDTYRPNGLDCSGFVSWAILNGGFDIGDQGANGWSYSDNDLTNHGDKQYITWDLLNSRRVKAGDLASIPGHIAIVVGIDYDNQMIYIAEELRYSQGLIVLSLTFTELITHMDFTHLVLMDEYYINDGNYSDMW